MSTTIVELKRRVAVTGTAGNTYDVLMDTVTTVLTGGIGEPPPVVSPLLTSLVAFYKLDEASGTRSDSVSTNHLTDNNTVTQAAGKVGNAAQFTAANSESLSITDNAALSLGADSDFTIACWIYLDSKATHMHIIAKRNAAAAIEYMLFYDTGADRFYFYITGTNIAATTIGSPATATWYFVVMWHDKTANTVNIQVNNGTADSAAWAGGTSDGDAAFRIGAYDGGQYFNGRVDAVGFWSRVLTADERATLYNGGSGLEHPF